MRHQSRNEHNENLRRRKRQQRRANRGAPHPSHYTECKPIEPLNGERHAKA